MGGYRRGLHPPRVRPSLIGNPPNPLKSLYLAQGLCSRSVFVELVAGLDMRLVAGQDWASRRIFHPARRPLWMALVRVATIDESEGEKMPLFQQKLKAFLIHFLISGLVVGTVATHAILVAYTPGVMALEGGYEIALLLFAVDLTLGPIMTAILYRPGKKGLKLDLTLVVAVQLCALFYGAWTLYSQKPLYLVYVDGDFYVAPAADIQPGPLADPSLEANYLIAPKLVYAEYPRGKNALAEVVQMIGQGKATHLHRRLYEPLLNHRQLVLDELDRLDHRHTLPDVWKAPLDAALADLAAEDGAGNASAGDSVVVARLLGYIGDTLVLLRRSDLSLVRILQPVEYD